MVFYDGCSYIYFNTHSMKMHNRLGTLVDFLDSTGSRLRPNHQYFIWNGSDTGFGEESGLNEYDVHFDLNTRDRVKEHKKSYRVGPVIPLPPHSRPARSDDLRDYKKLAEQIMAVMMEEKTLWLSLILSSDSRVRDVLKALDIALNTLKSAKNDAYMKPVHVNLMCEEKEEIHSQRVLLDEYEAYKYQDYKEWIDHMDSQGFTIKIRSWWWITNLQRGMEATPYPPYDSLLWTR